MSTSPTLDLARELIARRSGTPDDAGCQEILEARLTPLGFRCETTSANGVSNLWARRGDARPLVCFAGHTDVVPAGPLDAWHSDPFVPTVRDGFLYGRGAADMKSSLAAFVVSIEGFAAAHSLHRGSIALLITSGEPSSVDRLGDMIKNGRRGTLSGTLVIHGVQGHIAYPHLAKNPILLVAPAIAELATMHWDDGNEYFPPTTWQASNVHAGTGATNVIPGTLELQFNFRYATASTRESLEQRMKAVLDRHALDYELEWTGHGKPFLTPRGRLVEVVADTVREVCGVIPELSCTGGTSDGRFIADICREVVELGPVNATIHKQNERVAVADLEPLSALYRGILQRMLA